MTELFQLIAPSRRRRVAILAVCGILGLALSFFVPNVTFIFPVLVTMIAMVAGFSSLCSP